MLPSTNAPSNIDAGSNCTNSGGTTHVSICVKPIDDAFKEILKSSKQFETLKLNEGKKLTESHKIL